MQILLSIINELSDRIFRHETEIKDESDKITSLTSLKVYLTIDKITYLTIT